MSNADLRSQLIADAGHFYHQGWMVGTAGNLSARVDDQTFWITASGRAKGQLTPDDFVLIQAEGTVERAIATPKPSAETAIHQTLYRLFPDAQACYHVHSIEANLVSRLVEGEMLPLPPLEMLKGLGIWDDHPDCGMPIFDNHSQVSKIAHDIETRFLTQSPQVPALLIRDHGVTVWAPSLIAARNFIELVEYIFRYMVSAHRSSIQIGPWNSV